MEQCKINIEVDQALMGTLKEGGKISVNQVDFSLENGKVELVLEPGSYNVWVHSEDLDCELGNLKVVEDRYYTLTRYSVRNGKMLLVALIISLALVASSFFITEQSGLYRLVGILGFFATSFVYYMEKYKESKTVRLVRKG